MTRKIALFNHKGGVSKTTTTFNLGWMLAEKGATVIIADADPQCNLTGMVLGFEGVERFDNFYRQGLNNNIKSGLAPAFEAQPRMIEAVECTPVSNRPGLLLLPGHIQLAEYEVTLGLAQDLTSAILTLANLPGSISHLLDQTAERYHADYVLIDLNPSLSSMNQNIVMTSDYFIVPTSPDYFSLMAVNSLSRIMRNWKIWADKVYNMETVRNSTYPFPSPRSRFLGILIQNFRKRAGAPSREFREWIERIQQEVRADFVPTLRTINLTLPENMYAACHIDTDYTLELVPNFNSLIAKSQTKCTPVFALTDEQIGRTGVVLQRTRENREEFHQLFSNLADKIIELTEHAVGN